jgi:hypothetical protein
LFLQLADKLREAFRKRFGEASLELLEETDTSANAKRSMKERFGLRKVKADSSGLVKAPLVSPVHLLQLDERFRYGWIDYSALDAKVRQGPTSMTCWFLLGSRTNTYLQTLVCEQVACFSAMSHLEISPQVGVAVWALLLTTLPDVSSPRCLSL